MKEWATETEVYCRFICNASVLSATNILVVQIFPTFLHSLQETADTLKFQKHINEAWKNLFTVM